MEQSNNLATSYLLSAFQAGDVAAFSKLYDMHVNVMVNYGCRLTNDKDLLKDCIHDVFVKLYIKKDELGCIENFRSYLFTSLKNKLCDEVRKRANISDTDVNEVVPGLVDTVEDDYVIEEGRRLEKKKIQHLMEQLSPRQREALTLYFLEEKNYDEICLIMDMNYQSVRNLMHRGLTKLRSVAI